VNDLNPKILDSQPKLYFLLQQQRMIELIRQGPEKISECLGFARRELAPRAAKNVSGYFERASFEDILIRNNFWRRWNV